MKTSIYILIITVLLSSCSGSKFLNRKYTGGRFIAYNNTLKHNTIKSDATKNYALLNNKIDLQKSISISEGQTEKEIITAKVNSIIKKDSIIINKKGFSRKKTIYKTNSLEDKIIINKNGKTQDIKYISRSQRTKKLTSSYLRKAKNSIFVSIVPFIGLGVCLTAWKRRKQLKAYNETEIRSKYKTRLIIATIISSLFTLAIIAAVIYIVLAISSVFGNATVAAFSGIQ